MNESTDTYCDKVEGCERLSVITPRYTTVAKGISETEKDVKNDNDINSCTASSDYVEFEIPRQTESWENSNSKTSSDCFESDWEFKQDTVAGGKEKLFLSLASHNGKLLSFSDNDQKHENSQKNIGQIKGISSHKFSRMETLRIFHYTT